MLGSWWSIWQTEIWENEIAIRSEQSKQLYKNYNKNVRGPLLNNKFSNADWRSEHCIRYKGSLWLFSTCQKCTAVSLWLWQSEKIGLHVWNKTIITILWPTLPYIHNTYSLWISLHHCTCRCTRVCTGSWILHTWYIFTGKVSKNACCLWRFLFLLRQTCFEGSPDAQWKIRHPQCVAAGSDGRSLPSVSGQNVLRNFFSNAAYPHEFVSVNVCEGLLYTNLTYLP